MSRPPTILIVDDEPNGFAVINALLSREGYELSYVTSGQEAIQYLETNFPDVILLDVMMPSLDGMETCRRIKSNASWEHIPIITITALNSKDDLARCLAAGANDFISKPVSGVELRARVASMLRIKQQYDALKAIMQLREDMSNMVVHDLRNPIAAILLASQLLFERNVLQGSDQDRLKRIQVAGQQLNSRVNDLLIMAKMESGKLVLNQTEVDLCKMATLVTTEFEETASSKQIRLEMDLPDSGCWISGDANLIHRLLDNLLTNAIKFSPRRTTITVGVANASEAEEMSAQAMIQVKDEGLGISEEVRQRIFEKFGTGSSIEGTQQLGLGLTFCKLVAEAHGGRITIEPNQPQGSVFKVLF